MYSESRSLRFSYFITTDHYNFHQFEVIGDTPAAFFDILAPPYSRNGAAFDRINYFSEMCFHSNDNNCDSDSYNQTWLTTVKHPDLFMSSDMYQGPKI